MAAKSPVESTRSTRSILPRRRIWPAGVSIWRAGRLPVGPKVRPMWAGRKRPRLRISRWARAMRRAIRRAALEQVAVAGAAEHDFLAEGCADAIDELIDHELEAGRAIACGPAAHDVLEGGFQKLVVETAEILRRHLVIGAVVKIEAVAGEMAVGACGKCFQLRHRRDQGGGEELRGDFFREGCGVGVGERGPCEGARDLQRIAAHVDAC